MASLFRLLFFAPIAVLIVLLALANRAPVQLSLDPMGGADWTITLPLFVAILGAAMVGILVGGIATWFGQGKHRRAARDSSREAKTAQAEVDRLRALLPADEPMSVSGLPATLNR